MSLAVAAQAEAWLGIQGLKFTGGSATCDAKSQVLNGISKVDLYPCG